MRSLTDKKQVRLMALLVMSSALFLAGCQSLEQIAPPVALISARPSGRMNLGRELYITKCTKCHAPEPIARYTESEWEKIVADMSVETKLTGEETTAVRDYVMAVLASAGRPQQPSRL